MKNESVIDYLERHIFECIHDRICLPEFISYDMMLKNIEDIFDIAKKYHKYQTIDILKYILNSENINEDYDAFAEKIYNKFFNQ